MTDSGTVPDPAEHMAADVLVGLFHDKLLAAVRDGARPSLLGDVDSVAQSMIDRLSLWLAPWATTVGPCHSSGSLQVELGVKRGVISRAFREDRLLRLTTSSGATVYPAFQVRGGALVRGLREILPALRSGTDDPWTWAQWLNATVPGGRDGRRHIDELADGQLEKVRADAERVARSWSS